MRIQFAVFPLPSVAGSSGRRSCLTRNVFADGHGRSVYVGAELFATAAESPGGSLPHRVPVFVGSIRRFRDLWDSALNFGAA